MEINDSKRNVVVILCDQLRAELPKREKMMLLLPIALAATLVLLLI